MTTLEKYIWVVNALYRAGSHGLSLKELSDKWERNESISYGEPLPRQTFNRWKDNNFKFPIDFNAKDYFSSFFGVVIDEDIPLQRIVVRAFGAHQHYMRSLPLHLSQKELCSCNDYADFELTLRPTYDFIMELQSYGTMIEVMEPQSLRQTMKCRISDLCKLYEND